MANRRTQIELVVVGLDDLRSLNTALLTHDKRLQALGVTYGGFGTAVGQVTASVTAMNRVVGQANITVQGAGSSGDRATRSMGSLLGVMLQYRAVSLVFEGVQKSIVAVTTAMYDMERQAARVQRVSQPGQAGVIRAGIAEEVARTGEDTKVVGEAFYQLKQQVKDNAVAFSALQTAMNLVVGTEADARQTTRAMLQIYNQFGDQLDKNVGQAEQFRRIGELLALTWKGADAEMIDITNSLKYLGPIADAAKVPIQQVTAAIGALTEEGHRGRMAGTEAGQFLTQIIKNFNPLTGMIENKGAFVKAGLTATGGVDLEKTLQNIVDTANRMPVEKARAFLVAISGTQNSFRFIGTTGPEFMRILREKIDEATRAIHGLTNEAERLRGQMTTTAQEWDRVWRGMFSLVSNLVDASPIRSWLHGIAADLERAAEAARGMATSNASAGGILTGGGAFPGDRNAAQRQSRMQASLLQGVLDEARQNRVSGDTGFKEIFGIPVSAPGTRNARGAQVYANAYQNLAPAERGYLQQFMTFSETADPGTRDVVMHLGAMQAELDRLRAQIAVTRGLPQGPPASAMDSRPSGLGLTGLSPSQAANAAIIMDVAKKHGIDPMALIAVAYAESGLNATNRNPASTATGLFQLLQSTAPGINRSDARANAAFAGNALANMPQGLTGVAAAQWIVENFERPGRAGVRADMAGVAQFYRKHVVGGYNAPEDDEKQRAAEEAARDAAQKRLEHVQDELGKAQADYQIKFAQFGPGDQRTAGASQQVDVLRGVLANLQHDQATLMLNRAGVGTAFAENAQKAAEIAKQKADDAERAHEDAQKEHAAATEYYAENARTKYGLFAPATLALAQKAQQAAEATATGIDLQKLRDHAVGPIRSLLDTQKEATGAGAQSVTDAIAQLHEYAIEVANEITNALDARLHGRELGLRPNMLGGGADDRQGAMLAGNVADIQKTLDLLTKTTPDATEQIAQLKLRLEDANAALVDFHDTLDQKAYTRRVQAEQDASTLAAENITRLHRLRFATDEKGAYGNEVSKLSELLANSEAYLETVKARGGGDAHANEIREAAKQVVLAQQNLSDYQTDYKIQKYLNVRGQVQGQVQSSLMAFFHGQGDIGTAARGIGGTIVDAALEAQIKKFSDPLVTTVTQQILELQDNTKAITVLTSTIGGGSVYGTGGASSSGSGGLSAVIGTGVAAGIASAADAGKSAGQAAGRAVGGGAGRGGLSDLQKGASAALSAYSIFSTGQQQGVNAGNLLGGALSGASIGASFGPGGAAIGAGVGVLADLVGGLFHHSSKPTATPQDLNPAYYNAPSGFDVAAYNYSAYGKLPTVQDVGFAVKPQNVPIVNVFVDGAKVAAQKVVTQQTSSVSLSLINSYTDRHAPI